MDLEEVEFDQRNLPTAKVINFYSLLLKVKKKIDRVASQDKMASPAVVRTPSKEHKSRDQRSPEGKSKEQEAKVIAS